MILKKITKEIADEFYSKYEHLGNSGLGVWHYGLYEGDELLSVVSYGTTCFNTNRGALGSIAKNYNTKIIQLTRGGTKFNAPPNIPSQIIKLSLTAVRKTFGNSLIVAYSDVKWNEIGTIYQACNFLYLGVTEPGGQSNYILNGKKLSGWVVRKKYGTRNINILKSMGLDVNKIPLNPKHRYLYINAPSVLKKFITRDLSSLKQDYPKRSHYAVGSMHEIRTKLNLNCY